MRPHLFAILACALVTVSLAQSPTLDVAQVGQSLVFTLTGDVMEEQWGFSYSTDGGSRWQPIDPSCLSKSQSSRGRLLVTWDVLKCVDEFEVSNAVFKASIAECSRSVKFDGYYYDVIQIGNQCWFAENLRSTHYANGTTIPYILGELEWSLLSAGGQCAYQDDARQLRSHGRLYNWYAVINSNGLCPSNWHVPTDEEWSQLEVELGMQEGGRSVDGLRGEHGVYLKVRDFHGVNNSGFSALPAGSRSDKGNFYNGDTHAYFWSSSANGENVWYRRLFSGNQFVFRSSISPRSGFSVRCIRD